MVFGQLPNTLERFNLNVEGEVVQEEDLADFIKFPQEVESITSNNNDNEQSSYNKQEDVQGHTNFHSQQRRQSLDSKKSTTTVTVNGTVMASSKCGVKTKMNMKIPTESWQLDSN